MPAGLKRCFDMADRMLEIVIVEDDASMRQAIERILKTADYDARWYESAEEAIEVDVPMIADCLIFDIQLPGMSGFDLFRTLARSGKPAPTIFITAHDEQNMRAEAERLGAASYLTKPFSGKALLSAIAAATAKENE